MISMVSTCARSDRTRLENSHETVNETEEWFYQLKGAMLLRLVENAQIREMTINEGEMFLVPGKQIHLKQVD